MSNVVAIETQREDEWITWENFWTLWPRRVARKEAEKAWRRLSPTEQGEALKALPEWRRVWAMKDTQYIPHPATWLNGARWEDELPPEFRKVEKARAENKAFAEKMDKAKAERAGQ